MKKNVGGLDRVLRFILGVALIAFAIFGEKPLAYWGFLGIVPLLVATLRVCPLYSVFGFSTCPTRESTDDKSANS